MPGFGFGARAGARRRIVAGAVPRPVILAVLAGQSNMEGRAEREAQDTDIAGAAQYITDPNQAYHALSPDITPLYGPFTTSDIGAAGALGPGEYIARRLLADDPTAAIVVVPTARGSTCLIEGDRQWISDATRGAGGYLFENMIAQANAAYTAVQAAYPGRPIKVQLYWVQGEFDADGINAGHAGITRAAYRAALSDLFDRFRARVTGAASAPITIGSMVPERWHPTSPNRTQGYIDVNAAHVDLSVDMAGVRYAKGPDYTQAEVAGGVLDFLHYKPSRRVRLQGTALAAALSDAAGPTMTSPAAAGTSVGAKLALALACDDVHATYHLDGGADAGLFEISDRYFTPTLRWLGDGTGPAAGGYAVRVRARDGSGNYGPDQTIALTVAGAYGQGDQGPATATYLGSVQGSHFTNVPVVIPAVPLIAGLNLLTFSSAGGSGHIGGVSAPGGITGIKFYALDGDGGPAGEVYGLIMATGGNYDITVTPTGGNNYIVDTRVLVVGLTGTKATTFVAPTRDVGSVNPPFAMANATLPTDGIVVQLGTVPSTPASVTGGATWLGGAGSLAAISRASSGVTTIDAGGGLYAVTTLVFERSV